MEEQVSFNEGRQIHVPNALNWDWFQEAGLVEMLEQYLVKEFVGDGARFV